MAQPADKAEQIVMALEHYVKAYVDRHIHMATNDQPLIQARRDLADMLATAIK